MELEGKIRDYCCLLQSQENINLLMKIFRSFLPLFFFILFLTQMRLHWTWRFSTSVCYFFLLRAFRALFLLLFCYQPQQKPCASLSLLQIISLAKIAFLNSHYHRTPGTAGTESASTGFNVRETVNLTPHRWINVTRFNKPVRKAKF